MAENSAAEKTEEATQRKRQQAHERGNSAHSRDLSAAVVLFFSVLFLRYAGEGMVKDILNAVGLMITQSMEITTPSDREVLAYAPYWAMTFATIISPFLLTLFVFAVIAGISQVGFNISLEPLTLKFEKLNPVEGFKRMLNLRSLVTLVMSLGKVALVGFVAYLFVRDELLSINGLSGLGAIQIMTHTVKVMLELMLRLAAILLILALLDIWYQRYQWEQDLRMTKQEVKEELRDTDGDPQIKSRRRQIQRQLAQQRMMSEVPSAEVVVRNPTHFAVAISYDPDRDQVPFIVAKGLDRIALRIIKIAVENKVPVKYQPDLARTLCKLDIGEPVPEDLWQAVIEVLTWVYEGEKGQKMRRSLAF